jgi:hypothetical protein
MLDMWIKNISMAKIKQIKLSIFLSNNTIFFSCLLIPLLSSPSPLQQQHQYLFSVLRHRFNNTSLRHSPNHKTTLPIAPPPLALPQSTIHRAVFHPHSTNLKIDIEFFFYKLEY